MKLLEDIIIEHNGAIRIVSSGSEIVLLEDWENDKLAVDDEIMSDEVPDIFDMESDVLSNESIKKVADDVKRIASKVNGLLISAKVFNYATVLHVT